MARPIVVDTPLRDLHRESVEDLQQAPAKHAEALLELMDVLEGLHQRGVLTVVRGMLAAGDKLVESAVDALDSPQVIGGLRNLIALAKAAGSLDPAIVQSFACATAEMTREPRASEEPPSTLSLLAKLRSTEVRRGLAFAVQFMAVLGRQLGAGTEARQAAPQTSPRRSA
ncbi:MAG: DUF1641 domain-containing protein [Acidobacteriota bacterium]